MGTCFFKKHQKFDIDILNLDVIYGRSKNSNLDSFFDFRFI